MKYLLLSLLFFTAISTGMENPPRIPQENIDQAAQAMRNQASQAGPSFTERCAEGVAISLLTSLAGVIIVDLYQGSKGYTYHLLWGPSDQEKHQGINMLKAVEAIQTKKIKNMRKHQKYEAKNAELYLTYKQELIKQATDAKEKTELQTQLKNTLELYTEQKRAQMIAAASA